MVSRDVTINFMVTFNIFYGRLTKSITVKFTVIVNFTVDRIVYYVIFTLSLTKKFIVIVNFPVPFTVKQ